MKRSHEVIVVGAGPNGLAAAIVLARGDCRVTVYERHSSVGGGIASETLTLPGYVHDVCSSVYPLAVGSPFFHTLPMVQFGLQWSEPPVPLAHPLDDGTAVGLFRSVQETAQTLGRDRGRYAGLLDPFVTGWWPLARDVLAPPHLPVHPLLMARFAAVAGLPAAVLIRGAFRTGRARALLAGLATHAAQPLHRPLTSGFVLLMAAAGHAVGWPFARGGAQRLADALAGMVRSAGTTIKTDSPVRSLDELPACDAVICDVSPKQLIALAGRTLPPRFRHALARYRYGPGVFKVDWVLEGPIPWTAQLCREAGTIHVGGTFEEISGAEADVARGRHPERPFVLVAQPTICDSTRAPAGGHTAWAYCHVPRGSTFDMTERIERQVERFAPGFRDRIRSRHTMGPAAFEAHNPNLVGGDVTGGTATIRQTFARPTWRQYATPVRGLYLCSAATPPGGGVHGMCGYHAAQAVLRQLYDR